MGRGINDEDGSSSSPNVKVLSRSTPSTSKPIHSTTIFTGGDVFPRNPVRDPLAVIYVCIWSESTAPLVHCARKLAIAGKLLVDSGRRMPVNIADLPYLLNAFRTVTPCLIVRSCEVCVQLPFRMIYIWINLC